MATVYKLGNLSSSLSQRFSLEGVVQYNRVARTLEALPLESYDDQGDAKNIAFTMITGDADSVTGEGGQQTTAISEGTDFTNFTSDNFVSAILPWGQYGGGFWASDLVFNAAMKSGGSSRQAINLLKTKIESAITSGASVANQDTWSGTGTDGSGNPNIIGLLGGALAASGTYGGVPRATYPSTAGNVLANGGVGRPFTFDLLAQLENQIFVATSTEPDLAVLSPGVWRKYEQLFVALTRYDGTATKFNAGGNEFSWRGIRFIRDKDVPETATTGQLALLNTRHVKKVVLPHSADSSADVTKVKIVDGVGNNGANESTNTGIPFRIIPLYRSGNYLRFMVTFYVQIKVDRAGACGLLQDISIV